MSQSTGLAKKLFQVFLKDVKGNLERTFWPMQHHAVREKKVLYMRE